MRRTGACLTAIGLSLPPTARTVPSRGGPERRHALPQGLLVEPQIAAVGQHEETPRDHLLAVFDAHRHQADCHPPHRQRSRMTLAAFRHRSLRVQARQRGGRKRNGQLHG